MNSVCTARSTRLSGVVTVATRDGFHVASEASPVRGRKRTPARYGSESVGDGPVVTVQSLWIRGASMYVTLPCPSATA